MAECRRKENAFGACFFDQHLALVVEFGAKLAPQLGADAEVVELAAYLHDLAAVRDIADVKEHAALGADLSRRLLIQQGYSAQKARRVAECVASHSFPVPAGKNSPEEVCISHADAVARIVRPAYWLFYAFQVRKFDFVEGSQWLLEFAEKSWEQLVPAAKQMAQEGLMLTRRLLVEGRRASD